MKGCYTLRINDTEFVYDSRKKAIMFGLYRWNSMNSDTIDTMCTSSDETFKLFDQDGNLVYDFIDAKIRQKKRREIVTACREEELSDLIAITKLYTEEEE